MLDTCVDQLCKLCVIIVKVLVIFQMLVRCVLGIQESRRPFLPPSVQRTISPMDLVHLGNQALSLPVLGVDHSVIPQMSANFITTESVSNENVVSHMPVVFAPGPTQLQFVRSDFLGESSPLPCRVVSPVSVSKLEFYLQTNPDRQLVDFIIDGFTFLEIS